MSQSKFLLVNGILTLTQVFTIDDIIEYGKEINASLTNEDALLVLESLEQYIDPKLGVNEETILYAIQSVLEDQVVL